MVWPAARASGLRRAYIARCCLCCIRSSPSLHLRACTVLQDVFENTGAHFSVFPVVNYAQVKAHCQSLVDGEVRCGLWPPAGA